MALLKLGMPLTAISGKLGGQAISTTRNGVVIKNIVQPRKQPTFKQSIQRNVTTNVSSKWQFLTQIQRDAFITTAPNYTYTNRVGDVVARNGFQTFCFLNQNLHIIQLPLISDAPVYSAITKPIITNESVASNEFVIKGTNLIPNYLYTIYCQIHYSLGASGFTQQPIIIGNLTYNQLLLSFNIAPLIEANFTTQNRDYRATVQVVAIDKNTGNKDLTPVSISNNVIVSGLGLDIVSYYPFISDGNDYFLNNNPTYSGITYDNNGLVNGRAIFEGNLTQYLNLGNNQSLNFDVLGVVQSFTFCFWFYPTDNQRSFLLGKRGVISGTEPASYQYLNNRLVSSAQSWGDTIGVNQQFRGAANFIQNSWNFCAFVYNVDGTLIPYLNSIAMNLISTNGGYTVQTASNNDMILGRYFPNDAWIANGYMSELTFFNGSLTKSQLDTIRDTNLAGQTIIDIN